MTQADQISHLCQMIRGNVYHTHLLVMAEQWGYLPRLKEIAAKGGFASIGTSEIMDLDRSVRELRKLADEIDSVAIALKANALAKAS